MLGQEGILKEFSTLYWLLSLDTLKLWLASTSVGQGLPVYCVLLEWFSIQTPLDSFSFNLCGFFSDCWMFILEDLEDKLQASFPAGSVLEIILNIQVFRYLSLDRWISECVLASTFWGSSLVMYNHYQEYLVSLALPATSFLLTENSITFLGSQNCLQPSPCPQLTWTSVSSCLAALKHRCFSIPSTVFILQPFVT